MNEPIRVFHVPGSAQWTGGERFLLQMADHLDSRVFRLAMALPEKGPLEEELRWRHIPYEVVPLGNPANPASIRSLSRLFKEWKPHIVQAHGARSNFYARLACNGTPCISTIHHALADYPVSAPRRWVYAAADRLTAPRAAAIVCVAECLRKDFLNRCPGLWEKTHVISNGVDLERFDPRRYDRQHIRRLLSLGDRWTLLLVGRLAEDKGHAVLLKALNKIKEVLPPFRLLLAGEGLLRPALERKAQEMGLGDNIVFLGTRRDIPELMAAADAVILPSLSEGFPYALLEALAMGKTVIASHVNSVAEVMPTGEEGYLVPPLNPDALIEALLTVLWNKEDARDRAEAGRSRVQREYDLRKSLSKWETLYRSFTDDLLIQ